MTARFVILHHQVHDGEHWDLMVEQGDVLLTWRLPREPTGASSLPMPAERIADHRKAYLDYEGPLSGNRGEVRQWDRGDYETIEENESRVVVCLSGSKLSGRATLEHTGEPAAWTFYFSPD